MSVWQEIRESHGRDKLTMRRRVAFRRTAVLLLAAFGVRPGAGGRGCAAGHSQRRHLKRRPRHSRSSSTLRRRSIGRCRAARVALQEQVARTPGLSSGASIGSELSTSSRDVFLRRETASAALSSSTPIMWTRLIGLGQVETQEGDAESAAQTLRNCDRDRPAPHPGTLLPRQLVPDHGSDRLGAR